MNFDEKDDLWELLGKASEPAISPFFSRDVLREVRGLEQERPGVFAWLLCHWRAAAISTCAASLALGAVVTERSQRQERQELVAVAERVSSGPDYQVIGHLDELLDSEKNSVWLDTGTY